MMVCNLGQEKVVIPLIPYSQWGRSMRSTASFKPAIHDHLWLFKVNDISLPNHFLSFLSDILHFFKLNGINLHEHFLSFFKCLSFSKFNEIYLHAQKNWRFYLKMKSN